MNSSSAHIPPLREAARALEHCGTVSLSRRVEDFDRPERALHREKLHVAVPARDIRHTASPGRPE
jgi:hypothetical protein